MTQQSADVRTLVEQIAKSLVDEPDQVSVNHLDGDVLELTVAPNDVGKVIGSKGRVARALRALIGAAGVRLHKRFTLEILE
ncbi:MAG: KH domain-containing protein [Terriglobales bacterium]